MPVYTSDALILRTYKLAEADRIVVFLTRDRGKKRGVAKGARRAKSRFTGGLEALTRASVAYYERELRDLVRINYIEPQRSALAAVARGTGDASALGHAEYFAELIDEWAPEGHADERLYRLGASAIDALAAGAPIDRLARYFEFWLLRLQGVYPQLTACPACGGPFDGGAVMPPREQHYVCRRCAARQRHDRVARRAAVPPARRGRLPRGARRPPARRRPRARAGDRPSPPDSRCTSKRS